MVLRGRIKGKPKGTRTAGEQGWMTTSVMALPKRSVDNTIEAESSWRSHPYMCMSDTIVWPEKMATNIHPVSFYNRRDSSHD